MAASAWLSKARPATASRDDFIADALETSEVIGSPGFPRQDDAVRERAGRLYDRAYYPLGHGRQLLASIASGVSATMS